MIDNWTKRQQQKYEAALQRCTTVAREEYEHAQKALAEAETLIRELQRGMKAARIAAQAGSTVQNAQESLADLNRRLDGIVTEQLAATSASLATKKARLEKFTVTLFGRTMAGKSTIREALTHGNGGTIGKGAQRTTRDIREYEWKHLRIVDTPGIGAYEGKADGEIAKSVIDESDVLLFLVSSDSIQESSFRAMQDLRDQNKPVIFVLNVKHDLTQPVYWRKFLKSPYSVMGKEAAGHLSRIRKLASDELGICNVTVIQVHAQAAFLATRPEYAEQSLALYRASGMDDLLEELTDEVLQRGPVRRLQTLLDGTILQLIELQESLCREAHTLRDNAELLEKKFGELNVRLSGYIDGVDERIERRVSEMLKWLRSSVSAFIDENIEREDIDSLWESRVRSEKIGEKMDEFQKTLCEEIRRDLEEFNRQTDIEYELLGKINVEGPRQYNPSNSRRNLRRFSRAAGVASSIAFTAVALGAANFWNPVGWVAGVLSAAAFGASWLLDNREKKLQLQKVETAKQLRDDIDSEKLRLARELKGWFEKEITGKLVGSIRQETSTLYNGMFGISRELETAASSCAKLQADLNRWLLLRCGQLVGEQVAKDTVSAWIARDPGTQTKCVGTASSSFCRKVGEALGERVDVQKRGSMQEMIAKALRPATVDPVKISFDQDGAIVRLSQNQISQAKGKNGINIRFAERLLKTPIRLREDKGTKL